MNFLHSLFNDPQQKQITNFSEMMVNGYVQRELMVLQFASSYPANEVQAAIRKVGQHASFETGINTLLGVAASHDDIDICHAAARAVVEISKRYEIRLHPKSD